MTRGPMFACGLSPAEDSIRKLVCHASAEMSHIVKTLKDRGLCSSVHYKEMYLPKEEIDGGQQAFPPFCRPCIACSTSFSSL